MTQGIPNRPVPPAAGSPPTFGGPEVSHDVGGNSPQNRPEYSTQTDRPGGSGGVASMVDTARGEAARAGGQVASTTAAQAGQVAAEIREQARDLLGEGRAQLQEQAVTGQHRAAEGLESAAHELRTMADHGEGGLPSELARQGADRLHTLAGWLEQREPGDLLEEVRGWARAHPGTFLLGAALAGMVAGRLTSGAVASRRDTQDTATAPGAPARPAPATAEYRSTPTMGGLPASQPVGAVPSGQQGSVPW